MEHTNLLLKSRTKLVQKEVEVWRTGVSGSATDRAGAGVGTCGSNDAVTSASAGPVGGASVRDADTSSGAIAGGHDLGCSVDGTGSGVNECRESALTSSVHGRSRAIARRLARCRGIRIIVGASADVDGPATGAATSTSARASDAGSGEDGRSGCTSSNATAHTPRLRECLPAGIDTGNRLRGSAGGSRGGGVRRVDVGGSSLVHVWTRNEDSARASQGPQAVVSHAHRESSEPAMDHEACAGLPRVLIDVFNHHIIGRSRPDFKGAVVEVDWLLDHGRLCLEEDNLLQGFDICTLSGLKSALESVAEKLLGVWRLKTTSARGVAGHGAGMRPCTQTGERDMHMEVWGVCSGTLDVWADTGGANTFASSHADLLSGLREAAASAARELGTVDSQYLNRFPVVPDGEEPEHRYTRLELLRDNAIWLRRLLTETDVRFGRALCVPGQTCAAVARSS